MLAGISGNVLANFETGNASAEFSDFSAEFVAENALSLQPGERVGLIDGYEYRAREIFMQIRAADATPMHADLYPSLGGCPRGRDLLHADITATAPYSGLHAWLMHRIFFAHG